MKLAVVLFNLGGPDGPDAVEPFLRNLFSDPAIIALPAPFRIPLARFIAKRRATVAEEIYAKIGGRSPILAETEAQARALEDMLGARGYDAKCFIAMRYWKPFSNETARAVKAWAPDKIVLLPLYPQFSTTTSASSLADWRKSANAIALGAPTSIVCCYPWDEHFIAAQVKRIREAFARARTDIEYRLLLSAHGLPERTVTRGDPYEWQVQRTSAAIVEILKIDMLDHSICYQSRVGPLKWIEPATDSEIRRAGADGKGVIIAPIAFVSEHSETLVELDIEYAKLAREANVRDYIRARTVGTEALFIKGLAGLVEKAMNRQIANCAQGRICPPGKSGCAWGKA